MIIGIAGKKGTGKDTAAETLGNFKNLKMAGALKAMFRAFLEYQEMEQTTIERMVEGDLKEVPSKKYLCGKSPRVFMQLLGTEFGRDLIDEDLWVNSTMRKAENYTNVKFTDIRFPNEHEAVKQAGGITVRVERDTEEDSTSSHASEMFIDSLPVDYLIINDSTIDQLQSEMKEIVVSCGGWDILKCS